VAERFERRAAELMQEADDLDRGSAEGDEQRDYAEERYNGWLLAEGSQ
jgi:hypothetical protein